METPSVEYPIISAAKIGRPSVRPFPTCVTCGKRLTISSRVGGNCRQCYRSMATQKSEAKVIRDSTGNIVEKRCSKCKKVLPVEYFHKESRRFTGLQAACAECCNEYRREKYLSNPEEFRRRQSKAKKNWHEKNRERHNRNVRNAALRRYFGLTLDGYEEMLASQHGKCGLCGSTKSGGQGAFHVDHDHDTNKIRGLLCNKCNRNLGVYELMIKRIGRAAIENWLLRTVEVDNAGRTLQIQRSISQEPCLSAHPQHPVPC